MCQCVNGTVLGSNIVITVPWEVQVSVGGFSVHPYCETSIFFWLDDSIQKRYWAILFCLLYSKLDWRIYCVDVLEELLLMFLLLYYQGIINIPFPNSRGVQCCCYSPLFKSLHENVGNDRANGWPHGCSLCLLIIDILEHKVGVVQTEGQKF